MTMKLPPYLSFRLKIKVRRQSDTKYRNLYCLYSQIVPDSNEQLWTKDKQKSPE